MTNSYLSFVSCIYFRNRLKVWKPPAEASRDSLCLAPIDRFVYLNTARKFHRIVETAKLKPQYPHPIFPFRNQYAAHPESLRLPEVQKVEREDQFLVQFMMDLRFREILNGQSREACKKTGKQVSAAPVDDTFAEAHRLFRQEVKICTRMIWASRMILDINDILGANISRPHSEMQETVMHARKIVDFQKPGPDGVAQPGGGGECWLRKDEDIFIIMHDVCEPIKTNHEFFVGAKNIQLEENARNPLHSVFTSLDSVPAKPFNMANHGATRDDQLVPPNDEPLFIFTHNPLYCGTRAFQTLIHMEHAGLTLASHHHTILSIANLSNALRKLNKLNLPWEDLDRAIELQMGPLFRSTLPSTPEDIQTNLMLRLGWSATTWAPPRDHKSLSTRHVSKYNKQTIQGPLLTGDPVAGIFRQ